MNDISVVLDQKDKVSENCEDNNFSKKVIQIEGNCNMAEAVVDIEDVIIMDGEDTAFINLSDLDGSYTYEWSDGSAENSLSVDEQGVYTVNIIDDLGCNIEKPSRSIRMIWSIPVMPITMALPICTIYWRLACSYDYEGTTRNQNDIHDWNGQPSFDWNTEIVEDENGELLETSFNSKHADSNGDGIVNSEDIAAIKANYHQLTSKKAAFAESEMALYVEATDTIIPGYEHVFAVNLGTEQTACRRLVWYCLHC